MNSLLVVTPTLGSQAYLDEVVRAVRRLTPEAAHVLSCPADRVAGLQDRFPGTRVVPDAGRQGGMYGAINCGIAAAASSDWRWFTYINDDDLWLDGFAEMLDRHHTMDDRSIAYGRTCYVDEQGRSFGVFPYESNPRYFVPLMRQGIPPLIQQGTLVGRRALEQLGGFDTSFRYAGDHDFFARAMSCGIPFHFYPLDVGAFRLREGQLSGNYDGLMQECAASSRRHFPPARSHWEDTFARWRFRLRNLPTYLQRVRRVGWRSSRQMLTGDLR